jgi:hypothetical protein
VLIGGVAVGGVLAALAACVGDDPQGTDAPAEPDSATQDTSMPADAAVGADTSADTSVPPAFATDPKNCGRANHDCLGGACAGGKCKSVAIANNQLTPNALLLSGGRIFWVNNGTVNINGVCAGATDGSVVSANLDGTDSKVIANNLSCPTLLAVAGSNIIVGVQSVPPNYVGSKIIKVAKDGTGVPATLYPDVKALGGLAVDGNDVFFGEAANVDAVSRGTLDAQAAVRIALGQPDPRALAVDVSTVFWLNVGPGGSFHRAPRATTTPFDGGAEAGTFISAEVAPSDTVIAGTSLYVLIQGTTGGSLHRLDTVTGVRTTIAVPLGNLPRSLAIDATHAYWTTKNIGINRVALGGGTIEPVEAPGPNGIDVDAVAIYFSVAENGQVRRLAK